MLRNHRLTQAIAAIAAFEETQQGWELGRSQALRGDPGRPKWWTTRSQQRQVENARRLLSIDRVLLGYIPSYGKWLGNPTKPCLCAAETFKRSISSSLLILDLRLFEAWKKQQIFSQMVCLMVICHGTICKKITNKSKFLVHFLGSSPAVSFTGDGTNFGVFLFFNTAKRWWGKRITPTFKYFKWQQQMAGGTNNWSFFLHFLCLRFFCI